MKQETVNEKSEPKKKPRESSSFKIPKSTPPQSMQAFVLHCLRETLFSEALIRGYEHYCRQGMTEASESESERVRM